MWRGETPTVDQRMRAEWLWVLIPGPSPTLANSCATEATDPVGWPLPTAKALSQFLVTVLSNAGSWIYYQNWSSKAAFFAYPRKTGHCLDSLSDNLQEGEPSQDIREVMKVCFEVDFSVWGLVRTGQSSWRDSVGLVDTARQGFPGQLKNTQLRRKLGWATCSREKGIFTQVRIS